MIADIGEVVFGPERRLTADDTGKRRCAWRKRCLGCELALSRQRAFQRLSAAASGRVPFEDPDQVPRSGTRAVSQGA